MRDHFAAVERATQRQVPQLHMDCPGGREHVWEWFQELRPRSFWPIAEPNPLPYAEIGAWSVLTSRSPTPDEVQSLRLLDRVFVIVLRSLNRER